MWFTFKENHRKKCLFSSACNQKQDAPRKENQINVRMNLKKDRIQPRMIASASLILLTVTVNVCVKGTCP